MLPCILIVNKIDLVDDDFIQNDNEIKKFAKDNNFDNLFKTSAKLGIGIDESMDYLIKNILERVEKFNNSNEKKPVEKNRLSLVLEKKKISDEKININNDCC
jgi:translation initiation factor 2 gamma subunit (eIF-2gamma)